MASLLLTIKKFVQQAIQVSRLCTYNLIGLHLDVNSQHHSYAHQHQSQQWMMTTHGYFGKCVLTIVFKDKCNLCRLFHWSLASELCGARSEWGVENMWRLEHSAQCMLMSQSLSADSPDKSYRQEV